MKIRVIAKSEIKVGVLPIGQPFICNDRLYMVILAVAGYREVLDLQTGCAFGESKFDGCTIRTDVNAENTY